MASATATKGRRRLLQRSVGTAGLCTAGSGTVEICQWGGRRSERARQPRRPQRWWSCFRSPTRRHRRGRGCRGGGRGRGARRGGDARRWSRLRRGGIKLLGKADSGKCCRRRRCCLWLCIAKHVWVGAGHSSAADVFEVWAQRYASIRDEIQKQDLLLQHRATLSELRPQFFRPPLPELELQVGVAFRKFRQRIASAWRAASRTLVVLPHRLCGAEISQAPGTTMQRQGPLELLV
mmetsp:Transcript_114244/g.295813  ORF Transcript_114244/g.295813 Transcript_114244/m.295813 type:complete len:235 (-) Transcript_114244:1157-1861(-)